MKKNWYTYTETVHSKPMHNWSQTLAYKMPFSSVLWNKTFVFLNMLWTIKTQWLASKICKDSIPYCNFLFKWEMIVKPQQEVRDVTILWWKCCWSPFQRHCYPYVMQHSHCIQSWMESDSRKSAPSPDTVHLSSQPSSMPFKICLCAIFGSCAISFGKQRSGS